MLVDNSRKTSKMFTCAYLVFIFIGTVCGADDKVAKLRFYHTSLDDYVELPLQNATYICSIPWFNTSKTTKILIHGFNGKPTGTAVKTIMKAYLDQDEYNVVLLNWQPLAADKYNNVPISYAGWALPNAVQLGSDFADALMVLFKTCLDINLIHILGHSLGGQIAGLTGNKLTRNGLQLPWITGLDPTGNVFDLNQPKDKLNPNSALFVDVIHSDPSNYGSRQSMGTVDFWPNYKSSGYVDQPGCDHNILYKKFSDEDLCNHNRCWQYMLDDQLKYPGTVLGSYAKDYKTWISYSKAQRNATVLEMGNYDLNAKPGNYFLTTNAASPYGRGTDGL